MSYPVMLPNSTWYKGSTLRSSLTEVRFMDSYVTPVTVTESWSADVDNSGSITCSVEGTVLTIAGNGSGKISLNPDSSKVFYSSGDFFSNVTTISGLNLLDTSSVTTLQAMFANCSSVTSLDIGSWDTSKVTSLRQTFTGCSALTGLDVSNWDTGNVETMLGMFSKASSLTRLDLSRWSTNKVTSFRNMFAGGQGIIMSLVSIGDTSNWNTSSLTEMEGMFQRCQYLEELGVSNWDVSKVTTMSSAFVGCSSLTSLDVSNWDTSSCTEINSIFSECSGLTTLDVSNWKTSNCTTMASMFYNCSGLINLDVSNWDVSQVNDMHLMFYDCNSLVNLDVSNWNVNKVRNMYAMFCDCNSLETIDVSKWNISTDNLTDINNNPIYINMSSLFYGCNSLKNLDVSNWDVSQVNRMDYMFAYCLSLSELDVSKWNVSNVINMESMFSQESYASNYAKFTKLDVSNWDVSNCTNMGWMFYGCAKLLELDLSKWNVSNVTSMHHMFAWCHQLKIKGLEKWRPDNCNTFNGMFHSTNIEYIDISEWNTSKCNDFCQMFERARNLKYIKGLDKIDTSNVKSFYQMFFGCQSLRELDLSNFDTRNADDTWKDPYRDESDVTYGVKDMFGLIQNQYEDPAQKYYGYMRNLRKITFGSNFSFNGNGNCIPVVLEVPDTTTIPYADGYWYDKNGAKYNAQEVNSTGTYYVTNINEDMLIKKGTIINITETLHHASGNYNNFLLKDVPHIIIDSNQTAINTYINEKILGGAW